MKTPEEIAQWVIDNRDPNKISEKTSDSVMYSVLVTSIKSMREDAEKELIDFHIEVMKAGLIHEGDAKWSDDYEPKIREVAEKVLTQFRNKQQDR